MSDSDHIAKLREGRAAWNEWRADRSEIVPGLCDLVWTTQAGRAGQAEGDTRLDLSGVLLARANLTGSMLSGANLSSADLQEANLSDAALIGVDLRYANLVNARLDHADLGETQ